MFHGFDKILFHLSAGKLLVVDLISNSISSLQIVAESISDGSSVVLKILLKSKKASPKKVTSRSTKDNFEFFKGKTF